MTVLITLTTVGIDCSTFDIYSNVDGFLSAFETDVPKGSLLTGFSSANVPDGTTVIRVKAKGVCTNYIDITLATITTTTTTSSTSTTTTTTTTIIPSIACSEYTSSGGEGVSEYNITLDNPLGGYIVVEFNAQGVPDKLEILHNGVKKATSGMTTSNSGPFDNLYGDPTIPTNSEATATDQFIGLSKGTIPSRQSEFASETGSSLIMDSSYQQLIWWVYSASDFSISNNVIIRITGPSGTAWTIKRLCETTPPISTTTTTTTIGTVLIDSQQAASDSGTYELKVINGNEGDQYKIRATATFNGTGTTVSFSNFNLSSSLSNTHLTRTGTLFSLDVNGELIGSYTVDGSGITCLVELLDSSGNVLGSTSFNTSAA